MNVYMDVEKHSSSQSAQRHVWPHPLLIYNHHFLGSFAPWRGRVCFHWRCNHVVEQRTGKPDVDGEMFVKQ